MDNIRLNMLCLAYGIPTTEIRSHQVLTEESGLCCNTKFFDDIAEKVFGKKDYTIHIVSTSQGINIALQAVMPVPRKNLVATATKLQKEHKKANKKLQRAKEKQELIERAEMRKIRMKLAKG